MLTAAGHPRDDCLHLHPPTCMPFLQRSQGSVEAPCPTIPCVKTQAMPAAAAVSRAYACLSDPDKRANYDRFG